MFAVVRGPKGRLVEGMQHEEEVVSMLICGGFTCMIRPLGGLSIVYDAPIIRGYTLLGGLWPPCSASSSYDRGR